MIKHHVEMVKERLTRFMAKYTKSLKKSIASRLVGKIEIGCSLVCSLASNHKSLWYLILDLSQIPKCNVRNAALQEKFKKIHCK